ncbi:MAG: efflux RND transporter permease subunit [Deferribacteres bacterium]|nr:efflux RND transporter permease subunit [candidate division KSB1 bacterium]MCB9501042.1 efflux RND transporter permease subunit [Deferribacteres bacterium]
MKHFKLSNKAIENRTTVYVFMVLLTIYGIMQYIATPKEKFPDVVFPYFMITTIQPGTSPADMENLISRPIEKELKGISEIKKLTSQSMQDVSLIIAEFDVTADEMQAYLDVKKAIDDARTELPTDLFQEPELRQIDVSEIPILYVNLSGDLGLVKLKDYADELQDVIEALGEITRVDIVGALDREIQINVDLYKMQAAGISFGQIQGAIAAENLTISGGLVPTDGIERNLRVVGEFERVDQIANIMLKEGIYVKDIAEVVDGFKDRESYARLNQEDVISLAVIKRSGENLIDSVDKIRLLVADFKSKAAENLEITVTGDMSTQTRNSVSDLFNTIILGFLVVVLVLMFFMGELDAIFVGVAIPLSMLIAFAVLPNINFTMNMIVLFAFILVLGIVVDNSIVVVENIYRHFKEDGGKDIEESTRNAVGEVALPVFTGTLTTLAPFFPLIFMPTIMGKFISYMPITLVITLSASMLVAYFMNPVFAVSFMKHEPDKSAVEHGKISRKTWKIIGGIFGFAIVLYILRAFVLANLITFALLAYIFLKTVMMKFIDYFQEHTLPWFMNLYRSQLAFMIKGKRPYAVVGGTIALLFVTFMLMGVFTPKVVFMPSGEPNMVIVYITMPEGTDVDQTNVVTKYVEKKVFEVIGKNNPDVESVVANVAVNAGAGLFDRATQAKRAKVTVTFVEYKFRHGKSTLTYLEEIRDAVKGVAGAKIEVDRDVMGPPPGKPISIEISGENIETLVHISDNLKKYIEKLVIPGIEDLRSDMETNKPEIVLTIQRDKAAKLSVSTAQIGSILRTALYGTEISTFREGEDEYPIQLRLDAKHRNDLDVLLSQELTVPGRNGGPSSKIPISAVADLKLVSSYGAIKRIDNERVITLASNLITGYNANQIISEIKKELPHFELPDGYSIQFSGEQEMQNEIGAFMVEALFIAIALILIILVAQFDSVGKPLIIATQIIFSIIGVLLGFIIFQIDLSIMMTGMGIIAVAGIVVKNAIILIDYIDEKMRDAKDPFQAIVDAGATRLTPVMLTALSTVLGLLPLAIGININFITLFTELDPQIFFGGDSVAFWNPLAWTIIFGLVFATFLTLIVVPAMYRIVYVRSKKS